VASTPITRPILETAEFLENPVPRNYPSQALRELLNSPDYSDPAILGKYGVDKILALQEARYWPSMPDLNELVEQEQSATNVLPVLETRPHLANAFQLQTHAYVTTLPRYRGEPAPPHPFGDRQPKKVARLTVLIHGTFARKARWWQKGSSFWNHVNLLRGGATGRSDLYSGGHPFSWSGKNDDMARKAAARELKQWLDRNTTDGAEVTAIAHSHGGNVCLLAAKQGQRFSKLVLLGTPIRTDYLVPPEGVIELFNVFSVDDIVQPLGGWPNKRGEGRTVSDNGSSYNYLADDDGSGSPPGHSDLHATGTWTHSGLDEIVS
jgi:pimeloyl-ACP methyl ester carboxylesterase